MELLSFYYHQEARSEWSGRAFETMFREAAAQRLVQALGAFGFLGFRRNLPAFLEHVPNGLDHLIDATARSERLPVLNGVARECRGIWARIKVPAGRPGMEPAC